MALALQAIKDVVGSKGYLEAADDKVPYEQPWRGAFAGKAALVVFPENTTQVANILRICQNERIGVVPQGGNTGLVGGSTPDESGKEIVMNMSRMKKIRALDPINATVTVEAGCILSVLKEQLAGQGFLFPLSMASEGSAEVGGIVSTNAGGTAVLRYGNTRDLVLGLEAVLPNGEVLNCLTGLRKDNTGYDLKHLFIGAEGTLGVVTAVTFKLFPAPVKNEVALLALGKLEDSLPLLQLFKKDAGDTLTAFELVPGIGIELVEKHIAGHRSPLSQPAEWSVLVELTTSNAKDELRSRVEQCLESAFNEGLVVDGVIAESVQQARSIWSIREHISEAQKKEGSTINFDISVPISAMAEFIVKGKALCEQVMPGTRAIPFGHIGDGNVHFNLVQPLDATGDAFQAKKSAIKEAIYDLVHQCAGSISAEHGIGRERKAELLTYKSPTALAVLHAVKQTLDPHNIMNPGRMIA